MTFQCKLAGCNKPRFTQAAKVIDHVRTNHPRDYKKTQEDIDMFRLNMISMPKSLCSYTCKECKVVFHGDVKIAIVHLVSLGQSMCLFALILLLSQWVYLPLRFPYYCTSTFSLPLTWRILEEFGVWTAASKLIIMTIIHLLAVFIRCPMYSVLYI